MMELPTESIAILMTLISPSLFLHTLGIYCLYKVKRIMRNQRIILINLSSVELFSSVYILVLLGGSFLHLSPEEIQTATEVQVIIYHAITFLFYASMTLVSVDRFVAVLWPTKYYKYAKESTMKKIVVAMWIISFASCIPFAFRIVSVAQHIQVILYASYVAQGIFLIITTVTYTLVGIALKKSENKFGKKKAEGKKGIKKNYLVPFLIILTFVLFYQLPQYFNKLTTPLALTIKMGVNYIGLSCDPILYIFLRKNLREIAVALIPWRCFKGRRPSEEESRLYLARLVTRTTNSKEKAKLKHKITKSTSYVDTPM